MKAYIYILALALLFVACQSKEGEIGEATLSLSVSRYGTPTLTTRAVDADLAVKILDSNGQLCRDKAGNTCLYPAGTAPERIVLAPGTFSVVAYTDNQDTWQTLNEGRGAACYIGQQSVTLELDKTTRCTIEAKATNYAVSLQLPDHFENFFSSHELRLKSGSRTTSITAGQRAYFAATDGFSYQLTATNIDRETNSTVELPYNEVEVGKRYNLRYFYGTGSNTGGIDIEIKDDMEPEDDDETM